jgi:hypothetical protein
LLQEVSFSIKRALGSRKGWKIMPDDGHSLDNEALRRVVSMIKDIEYQVDKDDIDQGHKISGR